jgi:hypothetical protein
MGLPIPHWIMRFYAAAALVLVPWTALRFVVLPRTQLDRRWNLAWGGRLGARGVARVYGMLGVAHVRMGHHGGHILGDAVAHRCVV